MNYVERFIIDEGHTAQRLEYDYGYDLILFTFDERGFPEEGAIYLQLKASEKLRKAAAGYIYDLDIRDYNLWKSEPMPVLLVLFDAGRRRAYWLHIQAYFAENVSRKPKRGTRRVRVYVPIGHALTRKAVAGIRMLKTKKITLYEGASNHD
jgi:hypothetical protein